MKTIKNFIIGWVSHPWIGTQHCLRQTDGCGQTCCNDHTGCMYNSGHNECMVETKSKKVFDSPLNRRSLNI
jgi:hypothetical protein